MTDDSDAGALDLACHATCSWRMPPETFAAALAPSRRRATPASCCPRWIRTATDAAAPARRARERTAWRRSRSRAGAGDRCRLRRSGRARRGCGAAARRRGPHRRPRRRPDERRAVRALRAPRGRRPARRLRAGGRARSARSPTTPHERGVTMTFEVLNRYETSVVNTAEQAMDSSSSAGPSTSASISTPSTWRSRRPTWPPRSAAAPKLGYLELGQSGRGSSHRRRRSRRPCAPALDTRLRRAGSASRPSRARCLPPVVADMLAIWRSPYDDGVRRSPPTRCGHPPRLVAEHAWAAALQRLSRSADRLIGSPEQPERRRNDDDHRHPDIRRPARRGGFRRPHPHRRRMGASAAAARSPRSSPPPAPRSRWSAWRTPRTSPAPPRARLARRRSGRRSLTPPARRCCAGPDSCGRSTPRRSPAGTSARSGRSRRWPASPCTSPPPSATRRLALPSAPLGSILSSEEPRLSLAQQMPVGVVGVISPFNVPLILGIRAVAPALALGNAVLLKPDPRTIITGGVSMVRIFEEAGLPAGLLQLVPGAPMSARRWSPIPACASSRSPARRAPAAPSARSPAGTSHARISSSAATRRTSSALTPTSTRRSTSRRGARSCTRARSA